MRDRKEPDSAGKEDRISDFNQPLSSNQTEENPKSLLKKESNAKWINNAGEEIEEIFGFNENAELVNGRAAMIGFLMLLLTELLYDGMPVTKSIFGIGL